MPLTSTDQMILRIESESFLHSSRKEAAITEALGITSVRYYQLLRRLIESRAAIEFDPLLIKRLRRHLDVTAGYPRG